MVGYDVPSNHVVGLAFKHSVPALTCKPKPGGDLSGVSGLCTSDERAEFRKPHQPLGVNVDIRFELGSFGAGIEQEPGPKFVDHAGASCRHGHPANLWMTHHHGHHVPSVRRLGDLVGG